MSRIGKQPVPIPKGVTVKKDGYNLVVKGPKGVLKWQFRPEIEVKVKKDKILVSRKKNDRFSRSLHGLTRSLIANLITGVNEGFAKTLELVGTGYRVQADGKKLVLSVGFSHPVTVEPVEGIEFGIEGKDKIIVRGLDKALVGQVAAKIRKIRPPEPYKGKGIRYEGEQVKKKPGKAGKVGTAGGFSEAGKGET